MVGQDENFLDLKETETGEILKVEHSSYAVKRGFLTYEMGLKPLPQWFYARLRINQLQWQQELPSLWATVTNTKNWKNPTADLF